MNAKVAVLLVLTLCAFVPPLTTTFNCIMPRVYGVTNYSVTENGDQPPQPLGDPIDGGGIPH